MNRQDRTALAAIVASVYDDPRHIPDAVLTSDWLAEHVRAKQAEAWQYGYEVAVADINWNQPHGTRKISPNPYEAGHE